MDISIASYSFHGLTGEGKMDVFGYLESVKWRYGLQTADLWSGTVGSVDEDFIRKVRQALDEKEMTVANYHVDGATAWAPSAERREQDHRVLEDHLRAAELLGAQTVRIDFGGSASEMTEEQFDIVAQAYTKWAKRATDNGYRVGPETHFGPALLPENQERVYKAVNSPAYGVLLHIGHFVNGREDEGDILCAPMAMHTHIDANITANRLEEKIRLLMSAGYTGFWGVEHHSARNEYAEVAFQLAAVRRTLSKINLEAAGK